MRHMLAFVVLATIVVARPAAAEVTASSDTGFAVAHESTVPAEPLAVWEKLRAPALWWSSAHSWSGDAANFYLDPQAGGCFCEALPDKDSNGRRGSVQHAQVLFAKPGAMLRLSGAFGPLQGEALNGTLTVTLKAAEGGGTLLRFEYVVGGYARFPLGAIAPEVDKVIGEQHGRLTALFAAN